MGRDRAKHAQRAAEVDRARTGKPALPRGTAETSTAERMQALSLRRDAAARVDACKLALDSYQEAPEATMAILSDLTADQDKTVRTAAASACARIARSHFARVTEALSAWCGSASPATRRAAAVVLARSADPLKLERAPRLVRLVEPLLADPAPAVRRSVSPSALGALLGAYPEAAFEALIGWSTSSDPCVLRNVATAFASPSAAPVAKRALIVLRKLALDERLAVWRAVASAMWQLGRRRPDIVRPELERWQSDDARAKVARQALKYL